jgi:hypothetical protein
VAAIRGRPSHFSGAGNPAPYHECDGLGAGQSLAFVYSCDSDAEARQAKVLTKPFVHKRSSLLAVDLIAIAQHRARRRPLLARGHVPIDEALGIFGERIVRVAPVL